MRYRIVYVKYDYSPTKTNLSFIGETEHFAIVFFGGAAIGLAIAAATHRLHALMNDPFSETALTVATVFGSVVAANSLGLSGLVAIAVASLYFGNEQHFTLLYH